MTVGELINALLNVKDQSLKVISEYDCGYGTANVGAVGIWTTSKAEKLVVLLESRHDVPVSHGKPIGDVEIVAEEAK